MDARHITKQHQHNIWTTAAIAMTDAEDQPLMRAPTTASTTFSDTFWDTLDDDWVRSATVTSDDDDDVNVRLLWFQQLQLTPLIDTGSSHSDDSPERYDAYDYVTSSVDADSDEACKAQRHGRVKVSQSRGNRGDVTSTRRRQTANVRERSRMRSINAAFDRLRAMLPPPSGSKAERRRERYGPSKVETLRLAVAYIGRLTRLVHTDDHQSDPLSPSDDVHCDALTSVVVVQSRPYPNVLHTDDDRTLRYSLSWSYSDGARRARSDVVVARLWTPERVSHRQPMPWSPADDVPSPAVYGFALAEDCERSFALTQLDRQRAAY